MKIETLVINLARRPDRRFSASGHIERLHLSASFVEAIDARNHDEVLDSPLGILRATEIACNASHARACSTFLAGDSEFALILEDDFEPRGISAQVEQNFTDFLNFLAREMQSRGIRILQLGHIRAAHPWWNLDRIVAVIRKIRGDSSTLQWRGFSLRLSRGDLLSGAHAYLLDRVGALEIASRSLDSSAIDDYLRVQSGLHPDRYARLTPLIFRQQSRDKEEKIDSDISG